MVYVGIPAGVSTGRGMIHASCVDGFFDRKYNTIPPTPDLEQINKYGGYSVTQDRLAHVDGDQDVW